MTRFSILHLFDYLFFDIIRWKYSTKTFSDLSKGTELNNNNKQRFDIVIYNNIMEAEFSDLNHVHYFVVFYAVHKLMNY